jgi:chorismate dehydratase
MKRFNRSLQQNMMMDYKKNVPSVINKRFENRKVNAAFISSIKGKKYRNAKLGIIAKNEVWSVIIIPKQVDQQDGASATSNALAKVLGFHGEVMIGDRALIYYLQNTNLIDLAKVWHEKHKLPFVFALLCYHKEKQKIEKIEKQFSKARIKIPRYMLNAASDKTGVKQNDILNYLTKISYKLDKKAQLGLKKFYRYAK